MVSLEYAPFGELKTFGGKLSLCEQGRAGQLNLLDMSFVNANGALFVEAADGAFEVLFGYAKLPEYHVWMAFV